MDAIIAAYELLKKAGTSSVLATVVHVEGSSYRRAGARMLIDEFGNITGAISGGCLEGDALRKALLAMHRQKNNLVTYDTSDEDDAVIGAQLGCNGIIQVLFEPLDYQKKHNPCELLKALIKQKDPAAIAVQFNLDRSKEQPGTLFMIYKNLKLEGEMPNKDIADIILKEAQISLEDKTNRFIEVSLEGVNQHVFIQNFEPPVNLVIIGAGNDAQILSRQAQLLGWDLTIIDGRPTHANNERFTGTCQVIISKPEETLKNIEPNKRSCFVLMSHNYNYDLAVLKLLLAYDDIPYIGILGPKKKYQRMLDELKVEGFELKPENLDRIYAPIGLEIGAETPAEIGLSILAEIQAVLTGNTAGHLRKKSGPIHNTKEDNFTKIRL
ncbi:MULTISPECIES: XdhC family protein [Antarcticibacterium]|nr:MULTISPECIES: XdhC/CoxI family protein [Antarcticibacterium]